ncbi:hypothetical protein Npun_F2575 [Nostoc punctiforme PCC 73102]|uniref:Uncharacterized protein n=2 Tax=Nostoc punctiforme TaxID=272131 RepID=B2J9V2_NOSP7|nr:hypothetical protein Npun_F2575 [Nostoc punctiforme PCC 73102]
MWNRLYEPEYQERGINQIFIFTAQFGELIIRLEVNPFEDELAKKLVAPEPQAFQNWQKKVEEQFKKLYGISIKQWQKR